MLSKTFEWLRVAVPKPDNAAVESRTKTVADLLATLDQGEDVSLLGELVTAAVADPAARFATDSRLIKTVVEAIRKYQPAFPGDLSENALEVRATCALTVGELIVRAPRKGQRADRTLAAALVQSGLGIRPDEAGKHLRAVMSDLHGAARDYSQQRAVAVRTRDPFDADKFDEVPQTGDVAGFWNSLKPVLKGAVEAIQAQRKIDREEVEVLWWFYNGHAVALGKQLADLPAQAAAVACSIEVADRVVLPPHQGLEPMVAEAVNRGRKAADLASRALSKVVSGWEGPVLQLAVGSADGEAAGTAQSFPALFPLTWLCRRLSETGGGSGWGKEFAAKTGLPADLALTAGQVATQMFRERVAGRLLIEEAGG
ncbi:MAG: GTPase-associated system all-helical protein GASH [Gemmataceae bacterium]